MRSEEEEARLPRWPNWLGVVDDDLELLRKSDQPQYDLLRFQPGFAVGDTHAARARLIELGAEAITAIEGGPGSGGFWCYFRDPEGNVFEISPATDPDPPRGR